MHEVIDKLVDILEANVREGLHMGRFMSKEVWVKQFCSLDINLPRQVGKKGDAL